MECHTALSAIDAKITVDFKKGWIFKHSAIPQARLLSREPLHWSMAVYIAAKFDAVAKDLSANGIGSTEQEAKVNARVWANIRLDEISSLHQSFQHRIQKRYDTETSGGEVPQFMRLIVNLTGKKIGNEKLTSTLKSINKTTQNFNHSQSDCEDFP